MKREILHRSKNLSSSNDKCLLNIIVTVNETCVVLKYCAGRREIMKGKGREIPHIIKNPISSDGECLECKSNSK